MRLALEAQSLNHWTTRKVPHPINENLSLKAFREFGPLTTSYLDSLLDALQKNGIFPSLQPRVVGRLALLHVSRSK